MYFARQSGVKLQSNDNFRGAPGVDWAYDSYVPGMEPVNRRTPNRCRVLAALVCLLAVVFVYVPIVAAAWSSQALACCTKGYCNIPQHHHKKAPASSATAEDCGHDGHNMSGMMDCSMSCCQDPDRPVVTSVAFVLPPAPVATSATIFTRAVERVHSIEIPRTIEPLSPPPRTDNAAL
jgi:hypothetical protein